MNSNTIVTMLVILVIFLVCRELMCWYWKQNEQVRLLKDIKLLLERQINNSSMDVAPERQKKILSTKSCKSCGHKNLPSNTHCLKCGNPM